MSNTPTYGTADKTDENRIRYSVSLVQQGGNQFYTLTLPSDVLAATCVVTTRKEDAIDGFQRVLDERRAQEIADYIDGGGSIPSSIVLSAQPAADLKIVGRGKTIEFNRTQGAFLILDGQHRVFGFAKVKKHLRVPVVVYNGLSRREETRLFIDINTKQKPVPSQLLLDIKQLAETETEAEVILRDVFDLFASDIESTMAGMMAASESVRNKISRVTFNLAVKPLLPVFSGREPYEIYAILNSYLAATAAELNKKDASSLLGKPVVFRAVLGIFKAVAQRVSDKYGNNFTAEKFQEFISSLYSGMPKRKMETSGTSWTSLRDYFEDRLASKLSL